eukprot:9190115-Lingulodinium_polyedra.AAC.1
MGPPANPPTRTATPKPPDPRLVVAKNPARKRGVDGGGDAHVDENGGGGDDGDDGGDNEKW